MISFPYDPRTPRIGAHLSVAGGLINAAENMIGIGGNCLQIFSGSPRGWARKPLEGLSFQEFHAWCKAHEFGPIFIHALYLINLAGNNSELVQHSLDALKYDLRYAAAIKAEGVIVHLGSHLGNGFKNVFDNLIERLGEILEHTPKESILLIENSAGQEGKLCSHLSDIRLIYDALPSYVKEGRLGWCLDTCHAWAAGYTFESLEKEITSTKLWDSLHVIHLNDSRDSFDSGRDRHENLGEGSIGRDVFRRFVHHDRFGRVPMILEVPGFDGKGPDAKNIAFVKSLLESHS